MYVMVILDLHRYKSSRPCFFNTDEDDEDNEDEDNDEDGENCMN